MSQLVLFFMRCPVAVGKVTVKEVQSIIDRINSDQLLIPATFEADLDAKLDYRDTAPFDSAWTAASKKLPEANVPAAFKGLQAEIRKAAFLKTLQLTESPELAGYVSDDFGLIASSLLLNISDDWVNGLWNEYAAGRFPADELIPVPGKLGELV